MSTKTMSWQADENGIVDRLAYIRKNRCFTDCEFQVGERIFPAHKVICAMSSPVFEKMIFGDSSKDPSAPIVISGIDAQTFGFVMDHLYTGQIKMRSVGMACKIMTVARDYMMPPMESLCLDYVFSELSNKNACKIYEFAKHFEAQQLLKDSLELIQMETSAVLMNCDYKKLDIETLLDILDLNELNIASELELFIAVLKYAKSHGYFEIDFDFESFFAIKLNAKRKTVRSVGASMVSSPSVKSMERAESLLSPDEESVTESTTNDLLTEAYSLSIDGKFIEDINIQKAISKIRFLAMTLEEFAYGPALSGLLMEHECVAIFINKIIPESDVSFPEGFSKEGKRGKYQELKQVFNSHNSSGTSG